MLKRCVLFACDNLEMDAQNFSRNPEKTSLWQEVNVDYNTETQTQTGVIFDRFNEDERANKSKVMSLKILATQTLEANEEELKTPLQFAMSLEDGNLLKAQTNEKTIKIAPPTKSNLALLQPLHENVAMHQSFQSTTSTSNTDICVLETHESYYGNKFDDEDDYYNNHRLERCIDAPDFTVLHAPQAQRRHSCGAFDESTEVLLMQSECNESKKSQTYSGTDSDVEVLMSEEIIDSDWSAGAAGAADDSDDNNTQENSKGTNDKLTPVEIYLAMPPLKQESTEADISVQEFSGGVINIMSTYEKMNRAQLMQVVREQAGRIQYMERTLQHYRNVQQSFFDHVDSLRLELETTNICIDPAEDNPII